MYTQKYMFVFSHTLCANASTFHDSCIIRNIYYLLIFLPLFSLSIWLVFHFVILLTKTLALKWCMYLTFYILI